MNDEAWRLDIVTAVLQGKPWPAPPAPSVGAPKAAEYAAATTVSNMRALRSVGTADLSNESKSTMPRSSSVSTNSSSPLENKKQGSKQKTRSKAPKPPVAVTSSALSRQDEREASADRNLATKVDRQTDRLHKMLSKESSMQDGNSNNKATSTNRVESSKTRPLDILIRAVCQNAEAEAKNMLGSDDTPSPPSPPSPPQEVPEQNKERPKFMFHQTVGEVSVVEPDDVLLGRTKTAMRHPGNQKFRELVRHYRESYQSTPLRDEKFHTINEIITVIRQRGGRFLKQDKSGRWLQVTIDDAYTKVSHALRMARKLGGHKKRDFVRRERERQKAVAAGYES